jgi:hypothetical protein
MRRTCSLNGKRLADRHRRAAVLGSREAPPIHLSCGLIEVLILYSVLRIADFIPMNIKLVSKIILIAVVICSGLSSCCTVNRRLGAYGIGPDAPLDVSPPINGDLTSRLAVSDSDCE